MTNITKFRTAHNFHSLSTWHTLWHVRYTATYALELDILPLQIRPYEPPALEGAGASERLWNGHLTGFTAYWPLVLGPASHRWRTRSAKDRTACSFWAMLFPRSHEPRAHKVRIFLSLSLSRLEQTFKADTTLKSSALATHKRTQVCPPSVITLCPCVSCGSNTAHAITFYSTMASLSRWHELCL